MNKKKKRDEHHWDKTQRWLVRIGTSLLTSAFIYYHITQPENIGLGITLFVVIGSVLGFIYSFLAP